MKAETWRDLRALEAIARNDRITQRWLARTLGIALGMANLYLKRLVRKGHVKCVTIPPNRIKYLLTPKGIAEKTRLTYEFMDYSLHLYAETRLHLRQILEPLAGRPNRRVAIFGSGEAAELAYLSILELGLDLVAVFDREAKGVFLGQAVLDVRQHRSTPFDVLVVATLDGFEPITAWLAEIGVPPEKLVGLRDDAFTAGTASPGSRVGSPDGP